VRLTGLSRVNIRFAAVCSSLSIFSGAVSRQAQFLPLARAAGYSYD
jgi:hypothetical protein